MDPRKLLEENVGLVDRVTRRVCRRCGYPAGEVEDFASAVKLALVESDYAILRRYEGRSSLATYLGTVVQRLLADEHERTQGRWRPSSQAERLGPRALLVEDVISRQHRSLDEALLLARSVEPSITRRDVMDIADCLPQRASRPREVPLPDEELRPLAAADRADAAAQDRELSNVSRRVRMLLGKTMSTWPAEDRRLVLLRFGSSFTIADIGRMLNLPQRPLYRRLESLLARLREVLVTAGVDPATADDLLSASHRIEIDFGLEWKNGVEHRTMKATARASSEEQTQ